MSNQDSFEGKYDLNDGYAGKSRPHFITIQIGDLDRDMTDEQLLSYYEECIEEDFAQTVTPVSDRSEEFLAWAKAGLAARESEN